MTEYEDGWGPRPDGYVFGDNKELVVESAGNMESTGSGYSVTAGTPRLVQVDDSFTGSITYEHKWPDYARHS